MERRSLHKFKRPMKFFLIRNLKFTMIKIIIVITIRHNLVVKRKKPTAPNQKQEKQVQVTLIIHIEHMPVKILTIISTIKIAHLMLKINLKNKNKNNMKKIKTINKKKLNKNQQISIGNKNKLVLRPHGKNFREEDNMKKKDNFVTKPLNKKL